MSRQYEKEFKENAVQYHHEHPELTIKECAEKLGYHTIHIMVGLIHTSIKEKTPSEVQEITHQMKPKR